MPALTPLGSAFRIDPTAVWAAADGGYAMGLDVTLTVSLAPDGSPALPGFNGAIAGFPAGGQLNISTETVAGTTIDGAAIGAPVLYSAAAAPDTGAVNCFAAGTRIATARGPVPVESVRPGDRVCTVLGGDMADVIWTGQRAIDCVRHARPERVWPIRVSAHAFGRGMPAREVYLSPDHAVYVDEVLIPIRLLENGRTVRQVPVDRVSYHHIELERHDVVLADGLPAETYLDCGDRARFSNGGGVIALHPDFSARMWEMQGCAPLVQTGPTVTRVRRRLAAVVLRRERRTRDTFAPGSTWPR